MLRFLICLLVKIRGMILLFMPSLGILNHVGIAVRRWKLGPILFALVAILPSAMIVMIMILRCTIAIFSIMV